MPFALQVLGYFQLICVRQIQLGDMYLQYFSQFVCFRANFFFVLLEAYLYNMMLAFTFLNSTLSLMEVIITIIILYFIVAQFPIL